MSFGIDVSHWQGTIDWTKVKASGKEFAIIKAGGSDNGFYTDSKFEENYANAKKAGVLVGTYYFVGSGFTSAEDGIADAKRFLNIIKGKQFEYPVFLDLESTKPSDKAGATEASIAFCETLENAGYYVGIYASDVSGFADRLELSKLDAYDKWVARYGSKPKIVPTYGMWQYSSTGKVDGINGNVDMNESFKDYSAIIKKVELNGLSKSTNVTTLIETPKPVQKPAKDSIDKVVSDIIKGVYGNDPARKNALKAKGYTDAELKDIYAKVNEKMSGENTTTARTITIGSKVKVRSGAVYGGLTSKRGSVIPAWVSNQVCTVQDIKVHNNVEEALIKELISWVAISSLTAV